MHDHHHHLEPSYSGSVVLDIGADVGALVVYVTAAEHGQEIEISPVGTDAPRTHTAVRERQVEDGSVYCLVYASLAAGEYTVWGDATTPAGTATVKGGEITELEWSDLTPA